MNKFITIFLMGSLLTTLLTWPLITRLTAYYYDQGDYGLIGWILWYTSKSILNGQILNPTDFFNANQFYPFPFSLAYSEILLIPSIIFLPIFLLTGHLVFSTNLLTFLSFILTFLAGFYTCRYFTKNTPSALVATLIYTFNPLAFAHLEGQHIHLLHRYFLPLIFLFGYQFLTNPTPKNTFAFFLTFTLNGLTSIYFQIFAIAILPLFFVPFLAFHFFKRNSTYFIKLLKFSFICLPILMILFYFNYPYFRFTRLENVKRSITENAFFSARGIDWFSPLPSNLIYGSQFYLTISQRNPKDDNGYLNVPEHTLFLNTIPIALFLLGAYFLTMKRKVNPLLRYGLFLSLAFSLIFTFGPFFYGWNNFTNYLSVSPYYYLHQNLAIFQGIRVPSRFQFIFYVPFSIITGFGFYYLISRFKKKVSLITLLVFLGIVIENIYILDLSSTSTLYGHLRQGKYNKEIEILRNKTTIHYPLPSNFFGNIRYLVWDTFTNEKIFNGYSGYFPVDWILLSQNFSIPNAEVVKRIKLLGFDYIVLHKKELADEDGVKVLDFSNQLKEKIVYQNDNTMIIDAKAVDIDTPVCHRSKLNVSLTTKSFPISDISGTWYKLLPSYNLENNYDCYHINLYNNMYLEIRSKIAGQDIKKTIKLPPLIRPFQKDTFK